MPKDYNYYSPGDAWVDAANQLGQGFQKGMGFGIENSLLTKREKQKAIDELQAELDKEQREKTYGLEKENRQRSLEMDKLAKQHEYRMIEIGSKPSPKPKPTKIPAAELGKLSLAQESIPNIDTVIKTLFPDGTPKSFRRDIAIAANPPAFGLFKGGIPFSKEGQNIARLMRTSLAGRQLIVTGVAARPDETKDLMKAFYAGAVSDPEAAFSGLMQLKDFYRSYIKNLKESGDISNIDTGAQMPEFNSEAEIESANLPDGTEIIYQGKPMRVRY